MTDMLPNESQAAREAYADAVRKLANQTIGDFVNVSGDTMTGTLEVPGFVATSAASISIVDSGAILNVGNATITGSTNIGAGLVVAANATGSTPATFQHTTLGGPTIAPLMIIASTASQVFFDFRGSGVLSMGSLNVTSGQMAGVIRVAINGMGGAAIGYIPIYKGIA